MREIKITVPKELAPKVARLALETGAKTASYHEAFFYGPNRTLGEMRIKTSTPTARVFISTLLDAPFYRRDQITISSHDIKSLVNDSSMSDITKPVIVPWTDIFVDLWQNSHVTSTFIAKVFGGALLLSYAMFNNNLILMIGALLFTPFTPLLMGVAFSWRVKDLHLFKQSLTAFLIGTALTILAAFLVAAFYAHPFQFKDFGTITSNLLISAVAGIIAALTDADDVGRRQLIALAAAFPYVKFPVWFGICFAKGFPDAHTTLVRSLAFGGNILVIVATTGLVYQLMGVPSQKLA